MIVFNRLYCSQKREVFRTITVLSVFENVVFGSRLARDNPTMQRLSGLDWSPPFGQYISINFEHLSVFLPWHPLPFSAIATNLREWTKWMIQTNHTRLQCVPNALVLVIIAVESRILKTRLKIYPFIDYYVRWKWHFLIIISQNV